MRAQACVVPTLLLVLFSHAWASAWEGEAARGSASEAIHFGRQSIATIGSVQQRGVAGGAAEGKQSADEDLLTADRLLELYRQRLLNSPLGSDVSAVAAELARLDTAGLPRLRFGQSATWEYDELVDLGLSASFSWSVSDPAARTRRALTAKRLALADHNERAQREAQLRELRRNLRFLAHLHEVEALLERHRRQLLALRPEWAPVAHPGEARGSQGALETLAVKDNTPGGYRGHLDYLEMVQTLERTRRERSLLLMMVAERVSLDPQQLDPVTLGRPSPPEVEGAPESCVEEVALLTPEGVRAGLLLAESRLTRRVEEARTLPQVYLDLSGNARYANSGSRDPWQAGVRISLRVALPASNGVSSEASVSFTPNGVSQELSVGWPPAAERDATDPTPAERTYGQTLGRVRLDALRDLKVLEDARDRSRLRAAELALVRDRLALPHGVAELNSLAQAELALLNAELEVDLALIEKEAECGATVREEVEPRP